MSKTDPMWVFENYGEAAELIDEHEAVIAQQATRIAELVASLDRKVEFMRQLAKDGAKLDDQIAALKAQPLSLTMELETEGWWNESHDVYTWPIRIGNWGGRVECHGNTPEEARQLALSVVRAPSPAASFTKRTGVPASINWPASMPTCKPIRALLRLCARATPSRRSPSMSFSFKMTAERNALREKVAQLETELAAIKAGQDEAVAEVLSNRIGNDTATIDKALRPGTKLYTVPPAPADAVSVPRELLDRLAKPGERIGDPDFWTALEELRALLAQSESEVRS